MATRFIDKEFGADSSTAIANDATGRAKVRNLVDAVGFVYDEVDNVFKFNKNGTIASIPDSTSNQTITDTIATTSSEFTRDVITTFDAAVGNNTASINGAIRGIIEGAALTKTNVAQAGLYGVYWITSTNASNWPKAAVIGEVHDGTTTADGAFVAILGGDAGSTSARAAYTVAKMSSTGANQFSYGVDLGPDTISGFNGNSFATADLRFSNQQLFVALTTAITANSTTTTAPSGSIGITSNATGVGKLFMSDGSKWQYAVVA